MLEGISFHQPSHDRRRNNRLLQWDEMGGEVRLVEGESDFLFLQRVVDDGVSSLFFLLFVLQVGDIS